MITTIIEIDGECYVLIPEKMWHKAGFPKDLEKVKLVVNKDKLIITIPKLKDKK